jgi:hypothetical protein
MQRMRARSRSASPRTWRNCQQVGVDPIYRPYVGDSPLKWVISENLHRRHLTESDRAMVAGRIANLKWGGDRKGENQAANLPLEPEGRDPALESPPLVPAQVPPPAPVTQAQAAKIMNVSVRSVAELRLCSPRRRGRLLGRGLRLHVHGVAITGLVDVLGRFGGIGRLGGMRGCLRHDRGADEGHCEQREGESVEHDGLLVPERLARIGEPGRRIRSCGGLSELRLNGSAPFR